VALVKLAFVVALAFLTVGLAGCAQDKDSDGDGLYDGVERQGWIVRVDTKNMHLEYQAKPDPKLIDSDGDGLTDFEEFIQIPATDPTKKDTDGDGLSDCQETFHTNVSECEDPTYAGPFDGGYPTNPTWLDSDAGYSILINDIWGFTDEAGNPYRIEHGDGISDYDEIMGYDVTFNGKTERITSVPTDSDWDDDGLADGAELYFGSHPKLADTDGDNCIDGYDDDPSQITKFSPGLQTMRLKHSFDTLGGADLRIFTLVHGQGEWLPGSGSFPIEVGDNDIRSLNPSPFSIDCIANPTPFTPWNPELAFQFLANDVDGAEAEEILLESSVKSYIWNAITGEIFLEGKSIGNGVATLEGPDATLTFSPVKISG
jgi:hypothetical protein